MGLFQARNGRYLSILKKFFSKSILFLPKNSNETIIFRSQQLFLLHTLKWWLNLCNVHNFFKFNKIWIRLTKYSLWVKLKCSHYKTFFEMLRYLPLLAWKWPMKCSMKCKVSWYFVSLWESLWRNERVAQIFADDTKEEKINKQILSQSDLNHDLNWMT